MLLIMYGLFRDRTQFVIEVLVVFPLVLSLVKFEELLLK